MENPKLEERNKKSGPFPATKSDRELELFAVAKMSDEAMEKGFTVYFLELLNKMKSWIEMGYENLMKPEETLQFLKELKAENENEETDLNACRLVQIYSWLEEFYLGWEREIHLIRFFRNTECFPLIEQMFLKYVTATIRFEKPFRGRVEYPMF